MEVVAVDSSAMVRTAVAGALLQMGVKEDQAPIPIHLVGVVLEAAPALVVIQEEEVVVSLEVIGDIPVWVRTQHIIRVGEGVVHM